MDVQVYKDALIRKRTEILGTGGIKPIQASMENNTRQGDMADQASGNNEVHIALKLKQNGITGIKVRAWRPHPMDDVDMVGVMRAAVGPVTRLMPPPVSHAKFPVVPRRTPSRSRCSR